MRRALFTCVLRRLMFVQNKLGSVPIACCLTLALMLVVFLRVERDVERLDAARIRLEDTLASYSPRLLPPPAGSSRQNEAVYSDAVLLYNRVPKTGSTSFVGIAYELCTKNNFHVLHVNVSKNNHILSLTDQARFVRNVSDWTSVKPSFYHGHMAFIDFSKFGVTTPPLYINLVRDPIDRLVSYYYFLRNGDDFRPHLKRRRAGNRETFDECVTNKGHDCTANDLWMQIPFFCGHAAECWIPGSEWALQMAKINLANHYLIVGITDEMEEFVAILEATLPRYFAGALDIYNTANRSHLRKTHNKLPPSSETIRRVQQWTTWKMENEFYEFAREQFHFIKRRTLTYQNSQISGVRPQQFVYEKIRPR